MPPRKKKPHPRSLDALFPRPAIKRCGMGHSQTPTWKRHQGCSTCRKDAEARAVAAMCNGAAEREEWRKRLGPPPAVMEMLEVSTGRIIRYALPPRVQRRGPRRSARI